MYPNVLLLLSCPVSEAIFVMLYVGSHVVTYLHLYFNIQIVGISRLMVGIVCDRDQEM